MKLNVLIIFCMGLILMSMGCVATQDDMSGLYARQTRLEAKTERLSKEVQALKRTESTGGTSDIELREKIFLMEEQIEKLKRSNSRLEARVNSLSTGGSDVSSGGSLGVEGKPDVEVDTRETEELMFDEGYTYLSDGKYEEAREQFKMFMHKYPKSPKATDALYWTADSYYREGEYEESILEYQRFIDTYPSDKRVPLSYLKQGLSLINIGRNEEAKLFLQTLIDKYPQSEEAKTAKEKISKLAVTR